MNFKIILLGNLLLIAGSCNHVNVELRNKLTFNDNIDTVQGALFQVLNYLDSLPEIPVEKGIARGYIIDDEYLYINDFNKKRLTDSLKIPGLSPNSSREFIQLITFLKKNFITSASKPEYNFWYFDYRRLKYAENDYFRDIIVLQKSSDTIGLYVENKIIDQKKNLLLVAPKNP